LSDVKQTLNIV